MLSEIKRKGVHLIGLLIPICYYFIESQTVAISIIVPLTILYLAIELLRLNNPKVQAIFLRRFSSMLRSHERKGLTGTGYYMLSASLCVIFFEQGLAIACLSFLVLGDLFAALIGKRWGKIKIFSKSLEGSFACFVICLIVGFPIAWLFHLEPTVILIGALTATIVELIPLKIDDNLTIPLVSGWVMHILIAFPLFIT